MRGGKLKGKTDKTIERPAINWLTVEVPVVDVVVVVVLVVVGVSVGFLYFMNLVGVEVRGRCWWWKIITH